jgi:S-adenosylmethionine:tRNA ribosyltransferase-isomerase
MRPGFQPHSTSRNSAFETGKFNHTDTHMTREKTDDLPVDYDLESYAFDLPSEQIAQVPCEDRQGSRLLILDRTSGSIRHEQFSRLGDFLPPQSVIVTNVSKVIPARLHGRKRTTRGKVEFLLLTPLPAVECSRTKDGHCRARVEGLLRPAKGLRAGSRVDLPGEMELQVEAVHDFGRSTVFLEWKGDLAAILASCGNLPLPPYIRRPEGPKDRQRYQTVYARAEGLGSVAAPTAGLHFTQGHIRDLQAQGHTFVDLILYVGYGTFTPIRVRDIRTHRMHAELMQISEQSAQTLRQAAAAGRPIVAVGTTSVRALESAYARFGDIRAFCGWTDLYLYPGASFGVVDHLLTNFHLPRSSLILMVAAFAGRQQVLDAYEQAVARGYRFFSYGDAMFIK